MAKWHVSPQDGVARTCSAEVRSCSYAHADSEAGAYQLNEQIMKAEGHHSFATVNSASVDASAKDQKLVDIIALKDTVDFKNIDLEYGAFYNDEGMAIHRANELKLKEALESLNPEEKKAYDLKLADKELSANHNHFSAGGARILDYQYKGVKIEKFLKDSQALNKPEVAIYWERARNVNDYKLKALKVYHMEQRDGSLPKDKLRITAKSRLKKVQYDTIRKERDELHEFLTHEQLPTLSEADKTYAPPRILLT